MTALRDRLALGALDYPVPARARNSAVTAGAVIVIIASLGLGAVLLRRPATLSHDRS